MLVYVLSRFEVSIIGRECTIEEVDNIHIGLEERGLKVSYRTLEISSPGHHLNEAVSNTACKKILR